MDLALGIVTRTLKEIVVVAKPARLERKRVLRWQQTWKKRSRICRNSLRRQQVYRRRSWESSSKGRNGIGMKKKKDEVLFRRWGLNDAAAFWRHVSWGFWRVLTGFSCSCNSILYVFVRRRWWRRLLWRSFWTTREAAFGPSCSSSLSVDLFFVGGSKGWSTPAYLYRIEGVVCTADRECGSLFVNFI